MINIICRIRKYKNFYLLRNYSSTINKIPNYLNNVFETKVEREILKKFPSKLLKKKPNPKSYYIANSKIAKTIVQHIKNDLKQNDIVMEINPGLGILTKELLKTNISKMILIEALDSFEKNLKQIESLNPGRVRIKNGDFLHLWKLAFRDKVDNGTRLNNLLSDVPSKEYNEDPNMKVFATVESLTFFKHLITSLAFERSLFLYGRCEMYLIVPPPIYLHLTCSNEAGYLLYRSNSILFQIMFEYRFITKLPKKYFLPWAYETSEKKNTKSAKFSSIDPEYFYLIWIMPRRNLYELCPPENLKPLWYFVKQNCISRKNRVIPNLEKWAPGCGPRLIIQPNKKANIEKLFPDNDTSLLPQYSKPCTTMSLDHYTSINIFTEFGDLSPSQMLTLFSLFSSWPEYKGSSFLASLESSLIKMESSHLETEELNSLEIDDDQSHEENTSCSKTENQ